jgi:hypothetical protein
MIAVGSFWHCAADFGDATIPSAAEGLQTRLVVADDAKD